MTVSSCGAAAKFSVTGIVTLAARVDAEGHAQPQRVVKRDIQVDGVRGMPPWAFEVALDSGSLARAAVLGWQEAAALAKHGPVVVEREFQWTLGGASSCNSSDKKCSPNVTIDRIERVE